MTPKHDAYLENGTNIGLTVGILIIAYAFMLVNIQKIYLGNLKINLSIPSFSNFENSSS